MRVLIPVTTSTTLPAETGHSSTTSLKVAHHRPKVSVAGGTVVATQGGAYHPQEI